MRNIFAFIIGWFLFIFAVVGQKQFSDSANIFIPVSFAFTQEKPVSKEINEKTANKKVGSSDGYRQNKGIIIGAIIGVVVLVALLK